MLGEDPKLTIAKIMGRKVNLDASYLKIEKNFYRNNGKMVEGKEVPFDVPKRRGSLNSNAAGLLDSAKSVYIRIGSGDWLKTIIGKKKGKYEKSKKKTVCCVHLMMILFHLIYNNSPLCMIASLKHFHSLN